MRQHHDAAVLRAMLSQFDIPLLSSLQATKTHCIRVVRGWRRSEDVWAITVLHRRLSQRTVWQCAHVHHTHGSAHDPSHMHHERASCIRCNCETDKSACHLLFAAVRSPVGT